MTEEYLLNCAELLVKYLQLDRAQELYLEVLKKNIKSLKGLKGLGICLYRKQYWEGAQKCFSAYDELGGSEEGKLWLSACYLMKGEPSIALKFFQENLGDENLLLELTHSELVPRDILDALQGLFIKTDLSPNSVREM